MKFTDRRFSCREKNIINLRNLYPKDIDDFLKWQQLDKNKKLKIKVNIIFEPNSEITFNQLNKQKEEGKTFFTLIRKEIKNTTIKQEIDITKCKCCTIF
jgi:hypothetical protein